MTIYRNLPCPAEDLVPHQPPMLCVDKLLSLAEEDSNKSHSRVEATVPSIGPFFCSGKVVPEYYIELLAQSAAAVQGFRCIKRNEPKPEGMLAAIDEFTLYKPPEPGEILIVSFQETMGFGPFVVIDGKIMRGECMMAKGCIKIWQQEQTEETRKG